MNDIGRRRALAPRAAGALALFAVLATLAACYPGGPENASDTGLVLTSEVPGADYSGLRTFAMQDTVWTLPIDDPDTEPLDTRYNRTIKRELRASMVAAGFTDVTADTATVEPDVWLVVGSVYGEVFYYYWWGGYPGYPGGGYWRPPYVGVGSFEKGSIVWTLVDNRADPAPGEGLPSVWYAGLDGALSNSSSTNDSRITNGIRQAFTQSPYIKGGQ